MDFITFALVLAGALLIESPVGLALIAGAVICNAASHSH
jgi:hypothetical protein